MWIRSHQISKRVLAPGRAYSNGRTEFPPPAIVRASFGKGRAVASDGRNDSGLSTRAAAVIEFDSDNTAGRGESFL
ncbi:hypothetical protein AVEN_233847-1, partial [Araneus ventricosus]